MSSNPYDEILKGYSPMSDTTDTSAYDAILTPKKKSPYDDIIQSAAQAHGLDPDLIRATMRQESTFKPNAKSPKGASGLMQLMPDTARTLGVKNILDPKENIYGGAKYLKQQLDKFGGDVPKALAAYNAGPGAVVKYGGVPPYKETQDYVKRITGNYKGKGYANAPDPYESILSGYTPQQDTPPADIPQSAPPPTNPVDVMPTQTQLPPPTPMGVNDQLMPEGLSTQPVPESPDTLKAQMQAALNPKVKDRSAVLTTEPSQNAIFQNSGFTPIQVQQGTLWVNPVKARKLKLRTPQDIQMFVENNPDGMTRLIGKVENVGDNTGGNQPVVHTTAPDGTELSSSVVTNPETAAKQVDVDKKSFPDSRTQVTTTDQVALKRQQGTQTTAPSQKFDTQAFQQANDYLKSQGQPELTKEQFLATQQVQGSVTPSLKAEDFNIGDKKVTDYEPEQTVDGGTIRFNRDRVPVAWQKGMPKDRSLDANGVVATYTANEGLSQEDAFKKSLLEAGAKYGITPQQVNDRLATIKASGNPILQGWDNGKGVKNVIDVTWDDLKKAGVDVDNARRMEQAQSIDNVRTMPDMSPLPTFGEFVDEILGDRDQSGRLTDARRKQLEARTTLPDDTAAIDAVKQRLAMMPGVGGMMGTAGVNAVGGFLSKASTTLAGLNDYLGGAGILPAITQALYPEYDASNELGKFGNRIQKGTTESTPPNYKLVGEVGQMTGALPVYMAVGTLLGGNPVLTFGVTDLLSSKGAGASKGESLATGGKGAIIGGAVGGLQRLGGLVADRMLGATADKITGDTLDEAGSKVARTLVERGTALGGAATIGYTTSAIEGGTPEENRKNALMWLGMEFVGMLLHKSPGEKLTAKDLDAANGTIVRVPGKDGTPHDVLYTKDGEQLKATDVTGQVPPEALSGAVLPKIPKPADKLSEDFASQPEKGFQMTGGKSDNPAITSPEENAAMLAKRAAENAPETSANSSSESTASQEAINRLESEKNAGLKRVVVDTRSKTERPLIGVDAVDYVPKPHESVEYRGGGRNGEVIAQGDKVSPAYSPPERDVATKTEAKPETAEPDVYEINADELAPEKSAEKPIKEGSTVYNASGKEGEVVGKDGDNLLVQWTKPNGEMDGEPVPVRPDKVFTTQATVETKVAEKPIETKAAETKPTDTHQVYYNGKVVNMDYIKNPKEQFKYGAQRIADNLGTGGHTENVGYVKTPDGKIYEVSRSSRKAKPLTGDALETAKAKFESTAEPIKAKSTETKPVAKGQKVTYLGKEWEVAADPVNGKVTLKDSTGRGKLVSVDKVLPAEGLPDTQIKDILGDEPVTPKNAMAKAEEIVNAEDQRSASQNEGNVPANESKGGSEGTIEKPNTPLTESKTDAIPKPSELVKRESPKPIETGNAKAPVQDLKIFEKNKIFTPDAVAKARERLARKGTQFNAGLDPEVLHDLGVIGGAYIEAGARNFGEFASKMKDDIKGISDDVLKQVYELVHKNYGDKIPNLEPPEGTKEVKQGERGSSKIGKSIEQKAIEQGLTDGFPETAGYDKKYRDDQIQRVENVITQDYDAARRMVLGLEPIPHEISPVMLLRGMEEVAKARKDVQLQYELANSPLVSETSRHAQEMRFMQEREQDSATTALQAIRRERIAQTQKVLKGRTVEEAIKQEAEKLASTIKSQTKSTLQKRPTWDTFIKTITCK